MSRTRPVPPKVRTAITRSIKAIHLHDDEAGFTVDRMDGRRHTMDPVALYEELAIEVERTEMLDFAMDVVWKYLPASATGGRR